MNTPVKSDESKRAPLPKKAWALVHYGPDGHLLEFANGFGIYPTRDEAESCALDYRGAYKVVRVQIIEAVRS
jgi:hypothetical protein